MIDRHRALQVGGRLLAVGREIVRVIREREIPFLAAAIAYYAFVSLLPALLLAVAVASTVGGESLVERVLTILDEFLTPAGRDSLKTALTSARGRSSATVLGAGVLIWSTLRVFRSLDLAFSRVYGTETTLSIVEQVARAAVVLFSMGIGIWVMIVVGGAFAAIIPPGWDGLGFVFLLVGLTAVFLPLYYYLPNAGLDVRDALPGAVLAAVGWVVLQAGFQVYAASITQFTLYGVLGGILLLVTWFYFAAILLLVGVAVNRVLAGTGSAKSPAPDSHE
ncbi:MAG: YihY/virulence factor BrkB family protein [Halobacteriales archaeon]